MCTNDYNVRETILNATKAAHVDIRAIVVINITFNGRFMLHQLMTLYYFINRKLFPCFKPLQEIQTI